MGERKERNANHELLRIIAMFMIVFIHANMYLFYFVDGSLAVFCNGMVNGICNIGVSCFILISGYYGMKFDLKKFVKMECMMITYSILETILLCAIMPEEMQGAALLEQLVKTFLPFITRKYWFYSTYVCLFIISGYIQKFLDSLEKKELERLLIILLFLFSVLPTVFYFEVIPDNGKGLVQMIMVYMIGRYIKKYKDEKLPRYAGAVLPVLWVINGISHEVPLQVGGIYHHLCKDNSITNLIMAVILFYLFKELKVTSGFINRSARCIFAVFALNDALVTVTMKLLIRSGIRNAGGIGGFLTLTGIVALILLLCLLAGAVRELLLGKIDRKIGDFVHRKIIIITGRLESLLH